ncbi:MAG: TIGR02147 family protein [Bdellovibrionota bacterium]
MTKRLLKQKSKLIKPSGFMDYRRYLESLYNSVKSGSSEYTYMQFAEDLGFSATTVIRQIVSKSRPLTVKAGEKISVALKLVSIEKQYFLELISYCNSKETKKRDVHFANLLKVQQKLLPTSLDEAHLEYFKEWYHPVIRELVGQADFREDPKWIAKKLIPSIRPEQAKRSLILLEKLGMIKFDRVTEKYVQAESRVDTGPRVKGIGLANYHRKMIELGKDALTVVQAKKRDISAITVGVDAETAAKMKEMIHAFQVQLLEEAEKTVKPDQVYQVNIQFFSIAE